MFDRSNHVNCPCLCDSGAADVESFRTSAAGLLRRILSSAIGLLLLVLPLAGCGKTQPGKRPLVVFYAASLESAMERWSAMFRRREGIEVRSEASGSQVAARKVSELGRQADVVFAADYRVIEWLLMPDHAPWQVLFAANEIVLAHSQHSRYSDELSADNWRDVLLRPDVRLARADENLAPIGYQTLQVCMLSDMEAGVATTDTRRSLFARLRNDVPRSLVRPDIKSLATLLGLRVDYVFLFRSIAHEHNLKYLRLPAHLNLGDPKHKADYARAAVRIVKSTRGTEPETIVVRGSPVLYGLTIPVEAPQPEAAERFVRMVLGPDGRRVLEDLGFTALDPPLALGRSRMPPSLRALAGEYDEDSAD